VAFDDRFDDRQAQTGAPDFNGCVAGPEKLIENIGQIGGRDPQAGIGYLEDNLVPFGSPVNFYTSTRRGVFQCITDQIVNHLAHLHRVRQGGGEGIREVGGEGQPFFGCGGHAAINRETDELVDLDRLFAGVETGFNPAQVEQVVDQGGDVMHAGLHAPDEFALGIVDRANPIEQFYISQDGGEWGTQVMGYRPDEIILGLVELFQEGNIMDRYD
jgi:hypothetical protein